MITRTERAVQPSASAAFGTGSWAATGAPGGCPVSRRWNCWSWTARG